MKRILHNTEMLRQRDNSSIFTRRPSQRRQYLTAETFVDLKLCAATVR